ncbi:MAG: hypothetical protein ACOC8B_05330 [Gemmatimonadota bacterium]
MVEEDYAPDTTLAAITRMYEVDGFNPNTDDWFWLSNDSNGVIDQEARVQGCIGRHAGAAAEDHLRTLRQRSASP